MSKQYANVDQAGSATCGTMPILCIMAKSSLAPVLALLRQNRRQILEDLAHLVAIQSISTDQQHQEQIMLAGKLICRLMRRAGLENVELLQIGKSNPYAYGEWLGAPEKPTVFLYSHQDVQPADPETGWRSSPWKLTRRGGRLFGRGAADDKGAIVAQLAVVTAFLKTFEALPVNIKMLVESEEEIGSPNLPQFFEKYTNRIRSDTIVVCDTENLATGLPSITYSLRGIVQLLIEVETAKRPVHSGLGGGVVPDAALALNVLLARLYRGDHKPGIPAIERAVLPMSRQERKSLSRLPSDEQIWRRNFGVLPKVGLANDPRRHPYEQIWRRPSITIIAQEASSIQGRSNQILPKASAVISYRTVPNQRADDVFDAIRDVLVANPPWNARVTIKPLGSVDWWMTNPSSPTFDAARSALAEGYGKQVASIGGGGSIGFIKPLSELFDGAPALLLGIGDPKSNLHGPNESLHEGDFQKLIVSLTYLLHNLGELSTTREK